MKKMKIVPKGIASRYNIENGECGECRDLMNMRERNNAVETVGEWNKLGKIGQGSKLMLVDRRKEADYYLTCLGGNVYLNGVKTGEDYVECNTLICSLEGEVLWLQSVGRFVVAATSHGYRYLLYKKGEYVKLDFEEIMPQLIFGAVNTVVESEPVSGATLKGTYSDWSSLEAKDVTALRSEVTASYSRLVERVRQKGAYIQPVAVRYAVRMWDDSYARISAPVVVGNGIKLTSKITVRVDNDISGYEEGLLSASSYNVGVAVEKAPAEDWLSLIKSVDILVGEEMTPVTADDIVCRCETSGTMHYLSYSMRERERLVAISELVNPKKWKILTSITDVNALREREITAPNVSLAVSDKMGAIGAKPVAVLKSDLFTDVADCSIVSSLVNQNNHEVVANTGISLRGKLYSGGHVRRMRNQWSSVQYWGGNVIGESCKVLITAHLHTENGEAVKVTTEEYDYSPHSLNAMISYPDSRAEKISIKVLRGDIITEWTGKLVSCTEQGCAYFLNEKLNENVLTEGYSFYPVTEQNTEEPAYSEITVSDVGNPFSIVQRRNAGQGEVTCLVAVSKSIYSTTFGRYPVYAFATDGIYALSYKERGDYNDVQLIGRRVLGDKRIVAMSIDKVYFVAESGEFCSVSGKDVASLGREKNVAQMVWIKEQNELLMIYADGSVTVRLPTGRTYRRDVKGIKDVYGDFRDAYAINENGEISDLNDERRKLMSVVIDTYPVAPNGDERVAPMLYSVNVSSENQISATCELLGGDGVLCYQNCIAQISIEGECCHPVQSRVYAYPCRMLGVRLSGEMITGTIIGEINVTYR